jgi:hypothetical protein
MGEAEGIRGRVEEYFRARYNSLGCKRAASFGEFCLGDSMEVEEKKFKQELERARDLGLCYREFDFSLEFVKVLVIGGRAWVKLKENHRVVFQLTRDTVSAMRGMVHTLTLIKKTKGWHITSHRYRDEGANRPGSGRYTRYPKPGRGHPGPIKNSVPVLGMSEYNRRAAVEYAHRWALGRNPEYYDFENLGGDCTNFCSQVLYAGGCPMNNTKDLGWYYYGLNNRAPAWTGVEFFYRFVTGNTGTGPRGREVSPSGINLGDVIQLDLFHDNAFNHCLIVVANPEPGNINSILISCHTVDRDNYPLVYYNWRAIRYIHITGCGPQQRCRY